EIISEAVELTDLLHHLLDLLGLRCLDMEDQKKLLGEVDPGRKVLDLRGQRLALHLVNEQGLPDYIIYVAFQEAKFHDELSDGLPVRPAILFIIMQSLVRRLVTSCHQMFPSFRLSLPKGGLFNDAWRT